MSGQPPAARAAVALRMVASALGLCAMCLGLSVCLLVAPDRDEFLDGAAASSVGGGASSSTGTAGSGASAGAGGGPGGSGGSGGAECNVELFWSVGADITPGELVLDATHLYWATETHDGPSHVRRKAKVGDDPGAIATEVGGAGRIARQLCFYDDRLFWLARGGGKSAIETTGADGGPPVHVWDASNARYLASRDLGLAWATNADNLVHLVGSNAGAPVDAGTYEITDATKVAGLAGRGASLVAITIDAIEERHLWSLSGAPPCTACDHLTKVSAGARTPLFEPAGNVVFWLGSNGATRMVQDLDVSISGQPGNLLSDPVAPDSDAMDVSDTEVVWMTDVFSATFPAEFNEGIFRVAHAPHGQKPVRLVPAAGCAWPCQDTSTGRLVAADETHVYWSCLSPQSEAVVYRTPLPR